MEPSKQEIVKKIAKLAEGHAIKKEAIKALLDDLDKEKDYGQKHIDGMAAVNMIMKDIDAIEEEHRKLVLEIKKK